MVDLDQVLPSSATILVTPRTEPLPQIPLTGRWAGAGDNRTRDLLGGGSPDVTIREYRLGDDLRRIHWPTSARAGELMVRREEQQWQSRCTLLIDNRRISHRGYGPQSSMETAVSATASIMRYLVAQDFEVRLVSATGQSSSHGWHQGAGGVNLPEQLERLALMGMTRHEQLSTSWIEDTDHGGMLLAVLGHLGDADRDLLAGMAAAGDSAYAVVLDVVDLGPHRPAPRSRRPQHCAAAAGRPPPSNATARWPPPGWSWPDDRPDTPSRPPAPAAASPGPGSGSPRPLAPGAPAARAGRRLGRPVRVERHGRPQPLTFLIPTGMVGLAMALAGSGLRTVRVPAYVVAMVQALVALLGLNLIFAARAVAARRDPDRRVAARGLLRDRQRRRDPERLHGAGRGEPARTPGPS